MRCEIQWIDENGKPTPDDNPAVAFVTCDAHNLAFRNVKWFAICQWHWQRFDRELLAGKGWTSKPMYLPNVTWEAI